MLKLAYEPEYAKRKHRSFGRSFAGLQALRALLSIDTEATWPLVEPVYAEVVPVNLPGLDSMVDEIACQWRYRLRRAPRFGVPSRPSSLEA